MATRRAESYQHPEAESVLRPDVGTQAQFRKKKPPRTYRYDSSLSPSMEWDGQNSAREKGEALISAILESDTLEFAKTAASKLKSMSRPFLNWAGKAERLSFDVPTLPLFVHEKLSTKAIMETLQTHRRDKQLSLVDQLFGGQERPIADQVLHAYEYPDNWVNRLILGDALVVMNSLLHYESLGGQVQMIYMDPPYGVRFGSNFQPFVRRRDEKRGLLPVFATAVEHNDDVDLTREPEMVKAYRDTWECGLHSYLAYLRDRLFIARDLLHASGSIFLQISDENLHHVQEVLDEVFGRENFVAIIPFRKKTMPLGAKHLESICDYIIWYARDINRLKYNRLYTQMDVEGDVHWNYVELPDGTRRKMSAEELNNHAQLPQGSTPIRLMSLYPVGINRTGVFTVKVNGRSYDPPQGNSWFTHQEGMQRLIAAGRVEPYEGGKTLAYVLKLTDGPVTQLTNLWTDTSAPRDKAYVVQTSEKVIERCMLMATDPGDLVLDPTCGSGTTGWVAERWGRRWLMIDVSRIPLTLARQRLLTSVHPWYKLLDDKRGPVGGFEYRHKTNARGEQCGGIVRTISRGTFSGDEMPREITLTDRPEPDRSLIRVSGPFWVEATIPTPVDWDADGIDDSGADTAGAYGDYVSRMIEVLRKSPVLLLTGGKTLTLKNIRPPARTLSLSAEALVENSGNGSGIDGGKPVALVFGPESGAVSEKLVAEAAREAYQKSYSHLYVLGFAIQPNAREFIERCADIAGVAATYVQATPDLTMGDLLKNMRSSQLFSVCGLPEIKLHPLKDGLLQVELIGLDVFDPITMEVDHRAGDDVPAWLLDTDYNDLCFRVCQAFFPRTSAWDNLKKSLKVEFDESVWDHLSGSMSAPFEPGLNNKIAVKVIDDRGNELLVVRSLNEGRR